MALRLLLPRVFFALVTVAALACAQETIGSLHVKGLQRVPEAAALEFSGLHLADPFSQDALNAACQKMVDSGFFLSAAYTFTPSNNNGKISYAVDFQVTEDSDEMVRVKIDLPGIDGAAMLTRMEAQDRLIQPLMPNNDAATAYYRHAIEAELATAGTPMSLTIKRVLATRMQIAVVFRPVNPPRLTSVQFQGNAGLDSEVLFDTIRKVVLDQDYSELDLRQALALNTTPFYEERGYLRVSFGSITLAGANGTVTATVPVTEGPVWKLGNVDIAGTELPVAEMLRVANFPTAKLANWALISQSLDRMQDPLRASGYLERHIEPERIFHDETITVDLRIHVNKGQQFQFAALKIEGLPPALATAAQSDWQMVPGSTYNEVFEREYLRHLLSLNHDRRLEVSIRRNVRPNSTAVDVVILGHTR